MDLKLDSSGDIVLVDGRVQTVTDVEEVGQRIRLALLTHEGEWFREAEFGVPWARSILVKNPDIAVAEAILRSAVLDVPDVRRIKSLTLRVDAARKATVTYDVVVAPGTEVSDTVELETI